MLLLRAVLGVVILAEGRFYLAEPKPTPGDWLTGLAAMAAGALPGRTRWNGPFSESGWERGRYC